MRKKNKQPQFLTAHEAVQQIPDGAHVVIDGFLLSCLPEEAVRAMALRFQKTGHPCRITLVHAAGQGNSRGRGIDVLNLPGLVKRSIGGHWNLIPGMQRAALEERLEAYNLPQGIITHLIRNAASRGPGVISKIGLMTFVDPRLEGGKVNKSAKESLVELITLGGEQYLHYKPLTVDVALIRGTEADIHGNISQEEEPMLCSALSSAQAAYSNGGLVIAQVKRVKRDGLLRARSITVPGIYVDIIVEVEEEAYHQMADGIGFDPTLCGAAFRQGGSECDVLPLDARKIIARRALKELRPGAVANLGIGMPEGITTVAAEEGRLNDFTLTVESGPIGGMALSGTAFGCARNFEALIDPAAMFDFYQGGGLDIAFLGLAQADNQGNVNVSRFGERIAGCGGFIDITQHTDTVVFMGTFTAKGLVTACADGSLQILQEGAVKKFVHAVEQVTYSGAYALKRGARVLFVTERAVFQLTDAGLELMEYAPGVDIARDITAQMYMPPLIRAPKLMDRALFIS